MSYLALSPVESTLIDLNDQLIRNARAAVKSRNFEIYFLGGVLCFFQLLDGLFTALGISHFGPSIEGNPLIRSLVLLIGAIPALLIVKILGVGIVIVICSIGAKIRWLTLALRLVACVYLFAAVIPWSIILLRHVV